MKPADLDQLSGQLEAKHHIFARAKDGPFLCSTCEYYHSDSRECDHPALVRDVLAGRAGVTLKVRRGRVQEIEMGDCCDYHTKD